MSEQHIRTIKLPEFRITGNMSLEETLKKRKTVRDYEDRPISIEQVSQILWAAHGVTHGKYYTIPSAGALFPLEIYIVAEKVDGLETGLYHYKPVGHEIELIRKGSFLSQVSNVAYGQKALKNPPVVFIISAVISRTEVKYKERALRYVQIEVGHAGQNILLQAVGLGLASAPMGAFIDDQVKENLGLMGEPFYLLPVGYEK